MVFLSYRIWTIVVLLAGVIAFLSVEKSLTRDDALVANTGSAME